LAGERRGKEERETKETKVRVEVDLDGSGRSDISTGVGMLDHLLDQLARHSLIDITISAEGDLEVDPHHTAEDVAICLGRALGRALGERKGIVRFGHAVIPLDEALAIVAVDVSGRGFASTELSWTGERVGELPTELVGHLLWSLATEGRLTLHARTLAGASDHHKAEAVFKALARALGEAVRRDPRLGGEVPSTKGRL
jgi:imidazoleglycerol-phosphate dehydratase